MITFKGEKYACLKCIRGHRSSTCKHKERPLLQVRRRGRPQGDGNQRVAILIESEDGYVVGKKGHIEIDPQKHRKTLVDTSGGDVRFVKQDVDDEGDYLDDCDDEYDLEDDAGRAHGIDNPTSLGIFPPSPALTSSPSDLLMKARVAKNTLKVKRRLPETGMVYVPVGNGLYKKVSKQEYEQNRDEYERLELEDEMKSRSNDAENDTCSNPPHYHHNGEQQLQDDHHHHGSRTHTNSIPYPPLLIAPMSMDGTAVDYPTDLYYAPSCVLGNCECGDSCSCEGCPEHDPNARWDTNNHTAEQVGLPPANVPEHLGDPYCPLGLAEHVERMKQHQLNAHCTDDAFAPITSAVDLVSRMELIGCEMIERDLAHAHYDHIMTAQEAAVTTIPAAATSTSGKSCCK